MSTLLQGFQLIELRFQRLEQVQVGFMDFVD